MTPVGSEHRVPVVEPCLNIPIGWSFGASTMCRYGATQSKHAITRSAL